MDNDMSVNGELYNSFCSAFLKSPHVAVMIVDQGLNVLWCNEAYNREFGGAADLVGRKCYQVLGAPARHDGCPTQASLYKNKYTKCLFDFGDKNFFCLTLPLGNGKAAKIHTYLPKTADNKVEES
jgi:hypothetical protein